MDNQHETCILFVAQQKKHYLNAVSALFAQEIEAKVLKFDRKGFYMTVSQRAANPQMVDATFQVGVVHLSSTPSPFAPCFAHPFHNTQ